MSYNILLREMLVSTFFSTWGATNPRLALNWLGDREKKEVVLYVTALHPPRRGPKGAEGSNQMPHPATPIWSTRPVYEMRGRGEITYEGKEQIEALVQAFSPGFRSEVKQIQGQDRGGGAYTVEAAVLITADPLKNVGIDAYFDTASPLIASFRLYLWQDTFDKLKPTLPPGQPA
jgi:hypothetical protein